MRRHIVVGAVAAVISSATFGLCNDHLVLTDSTYGAVTFGGQLRDIESRLKETAKHETGDLGCDFVTFKKYPGITFMVENGVVTRADATSKSITNSLSIRVGTPVSVVKRRYPHVLIERHKYDPTGHYLIFKSGDGKRATVIEEASGKVTAVRAGLEPSVEYVEGCL